MKLVFYSPNFYPMVGGLEKVVMDLAAEVSRLGHQVKVITLTKASKPDAFPFDVVRQARFWDTVRHMRWSDIVVFFNVSLTGVVPGLVAGRRLMITHHGVYPTQSLNARVKRLVATFAFINTGCSAFIARHYKGGYLLPNPYEENLFKRHATTDKTKAVVFLGRLVTQKGVAVLLTALAVLKDTYKLYPSLTIIGDGPERVGLQQLVRWFALEEQVSFAGVQTGAPLAHLLNQHQILVVPSLGEEGFGNVVLEGIACGCFVIGSHAGGLPEAIGPCGVTFARGDADALARQLHRALTEPDWRAAYRHQADTHLQKHTRRAVANRFFAILKKHIHE